MNVNAEQMDVLEIKVKKDLQEAKRDFKTPFLAELKRILDNCFMMPKGRKENLITRDKLTIELLKLVHSQKKFKPSDNIFQTITNLAVLDNENNIGRIISINNATKTVEYITPYVLKNKDNTIVKKFSEVQLFDFNSSALEFFYREYTTKNSGTSYAKLWAFLNGEDYAEEQIDKSKDYGVEIVGEHPVMNEIIKEYGIPVIEKQKKEKSKLHALDPVTMEIMGVYDSVKHAAEVTGVSASTISNVLCTGKSAAKYLEAGARKWEYSDMPNPKYVK